MPTDTLSAALPDAASRKAPVRDALTPRLLFTDLDGSLLGPRSRDGALAHPWLARLKQHGVPVIPVTCRTRHELAPLRLSLGLADTPFIAENGAVVGLPPAWCHARLERSPGPDGVSVKTLGVDIAFIRKRLSVWRKRLGAEFTLTSEIALARLMEVAEVDEAEARLARMREGSEPLLWHGDDAQLEALREGLAGDGLSLLRGERFWYVTGQVDKGCAVEWLLGRFTALRGRRPQTLGLGDGPNDVGMLEAMDQAVVIRSRHGLAVEPAHPALYRTAAMGPAGWAEGVAHWWGRTDSRLMPRAARAA